MARSTGFVERRTGERRSKPPSAPWPPAASSSSSARLSAWYSISRAASPATSKPRISAGASSKLCPTRMLVASISSRVAALVATSSGSALVASSRDEKIASPVVISRRMGTQRYVASATNASVPSLPMMRCASSCTGDSKSRKALTAYPIVFFIANCLAMIDTEVGLSSTRRRNRRSPSTSAGSWARSCASASAAAVLMVVPLGRTMIIDSSVW